MAQKSKKELRIDSLNLIIDGEQYNDTTKIIARYKLGSITKLYRINYWDSIISDCKRIIKTSPSTAVKKSLLSPLAESLNNLGFISNNEGRISEALTAFHESLKICEEMKDQESIASRLNNIGYIYSSQNNNIKALEYYKKSLAIRKIMKDEEGVAGSLNNIGASYSDLGDTPKALAYYKESLKIKESIGDETGIAVSLNNIGSIYKGQGHIAKALEYHTKSLKIREELQENQMISFSLNHIASIMIIQGNIALAEKYAQRSLKISKELGYPDNISHTASLLSKIYEKENMNSRALEMYKLHILMRDSINNQSTQKTIVQQQAKYEYEKQKVIDDAQNEKLIAIEKEEKAKQKIIIYAAIFGLLLLMIFLVFVFNRLKVTRKQKEVIEKQKSVVEEAHSELEEKNKEITASIQYAKRIQSAILPPIKVVKEYLKESFILYKPKDIVAGDFYWLETSSSVSSQGGETSPSGKMSKTDGVVLFAAADCTGHGVPGAMVSVVCNNALNRSVREHGLTDPGEILDKTREIVIQEFEKSDEDVKDGMDIALCSLKLEDGSWKLQYAGANNPLWIIREKLKVASNKLVDDEVKIFQLEAFNFQLEEVKANKQPIGQFDNPQPYTTHTFELQKGDTIYIFSDGYVDQFGGEKGKKFKINSLRELLLSIQDKTMEEQKTIIDKTFEAWKGDLEQIDDVCIIGVRI